MIVLSIICVVKLTILVISNEIKSVIASNGKCGAPERCCIGRDSSCFVNSGDLSVGLETIDNSISEPCYCDEGCLETGDCCSDYEQVCTFEGEHYNLLNCFLLYLKNNIQRVKTFLYKLYIFYISKETTF